MTEVMECSLYHCTKKQLSFLSVFPASLSALSAALNGSVCELCSRRNAAHRDGALLVLARVTLLPNGVMDAVRLQTGVSITENDQSLVVNDSGDISRCIK